MNRQKVRICWITSGYLLQVDLPLLSSLKEFFDIHWVVLADPRSDMGKNAKEYAAQYGIDIEMRFARGHRYLPLCLLDYFSMCRDFAELNADIYYCNWTPFPYAWIPFEKYIPADRLIMAMHHGCLHDGMQLKHMYKYYLKHVTQRDVHFQYFSETQANGEYSAKDKSKVTVIPLALNDFGKSTKKPSCDHIEFLAFGHIIETKNIGLLIEAANKLYERLGNKFRVRIVGQCRLWDQLYQPLVKYPEIFELDIRMVPNEMIPDLFSSVHYLVLPYKAVTQSGPLRIAYGYNTPVITSDLDGFKESMVEGITGYMFETENVDALVEIMEKMVLGGQESYSSIKAKQKDYVDRNLSVSSVVEKYKMMFNNFIKK